MSAEPYSASLISRFAVPETNRIPQGYFRSKIFVTSSTTNPLVSAASPLLSLMERLSVSPILPKIENVRENIEHELFAFHSRLASQQYAAEFTVIADYLLSATVDELLGKNYLRLYHQHAEFKAFTPPSQSGSEPQRVFFDIVNFIKQRTSQYLDILELAYYCLITGFEGEQHARPDGRQNLDNLIEELYQLIQQHRANKPQRLFKEQTATPIVLRKNQKPTMIAAILAVSIIVSFYALSHMLLEHRAKTVLLEHTEHINMDN